MALLMLSYNLKRVLNILGVETFRTYCILRAKNRLGETKNTIWNMLRIVFLLLPDFRRSFSIKSTRGTPILT